MNVFSYKIRDFQTSHISKTLGYATSVEQKPDKGDLGVQVFEISSDIHRILKRLLGNKRSFSINNQCILKQSMWFHKINAKLLQRNIEIVKTDFSIFNKFSSFGGTWFMSPLNTKSWWRVQSLTRALKSLQLKLNELSQSDKSERWNARSSSGQALSLPSA